jgi:hypothetical protein
MGLDSVNWLPHDQALLAWLALRDFRRKHLSLEFQWVISPWQRGEGGRHDQIFGPLSFLWGEGKGATKHLLQFTC